MLSDAVMLQRIIVLWLENNAAKQADKAINKFKADIGKYKDITLLDQELIYHIQVLHDSLIANTKKAIETVVKFVITDIVRIIEPIEKELPKKEATTVDLKSTDYIDYIINKYNLFGKDWVSRYKRRTEELQSILKQAIVTGIAEGKGMRTIMYTLRRKTEVSKKSLLRIVRTEVMFASNVAAVEAYGELNDVVSGIRYKATFDTRTCIVCGSFDGSEYYGNPNQKQKGIADAPKPPLHPNCRCFLSPITYTWKQLGFKTKKDAPVKQPKEKFTEWFARQPEAHQRKLLGKNYERYVKNKDKTLKKYLTQTIDYDTVGQGLSSLWQQAK